MVQSAITQYNFGLCLNLIIILNTPRPYFWGASFRNFTVFYLETFYRKYINFIPRSVIDLDKGLKGNFYVSQINIGSYFQLAKYSWPVASCQISQFLYIYTDLTRRMEERFSNQENLCSREYTYHGLINYYNYCNYCN